MDLVATNDLKTRAKKAYEESRERRPHRASRCVRKTLGAHVAPADWNERRGGHGPYLVCTVGGYILGYDEDHDEGLLYVRSEATSEWARVTSVVHLGQLTHEWEETKHTGWTAIRHGQVTEHGGDET